MRTIKEIVQEALDVQNACNLSGVVHSFARALSDLREQPECRGNAWLHAHPATVLFADKVAHLTGTQDLGSSVVAKAYREAQAIIEGEAR